MIKTHAVIMTLVLSYRGMYAGDVILIYDVMVMSY